MLAVASLVALLACTGCGGGAAASRDGDPVRDYPDVRVFHLGAGVNSEADDFAPTLSADGRVLTFTSSRTRPASSGGDDLWSSIFDGTQWNAATALGTPVNTPGHEGAPSLSADGQELFFTACGRPDGAGGCDIYSVRLLGNEWSEPRPLPRTINTEAWESHPCISADGRSLYFASDRSGGEGGLDLWRVERGTDGTWGRPVNLGRPVNTTRDELSPAIASDGGTLYFSSNGRGGVGGTDVFVTRRQDSRWSMPEHLGTPLNSRDDDEFLRPTADGRAVYIASRRAGGYGALDVYRAEPNPVPPGAVLIIAGSVLDRGTLHPLAAVLTQVHNAPFGEAPPPARSNAATGAFTVVLGAGQLHTVIVRSEGYDTDTVRFDTRDLGSTEQRTLRVLLNRSGERDRLSAAVACDVLDDGISGRMATPPGRITIEEVRTSEVLPVLPFLFFDENAEGLPARYSQRTRPDEYSMDDLPRNALAAHAHLPDVIGARLRAMPEARIRLVGCTDGFERGGTELGRARARTVQRYLTEVWGIDASRIAVSGATLPAVPTSTTTPEGREENRRVDVFTDTNALLAPLERTSVERQIIPPQAVFLLSVRSMAGIRSWSLRLTHAGRTVFEREGGPSIPDTVVWHPEASLLRTTDEPVRFVLQVEDAAGIRAASEERELPLHVITLERKAAERLADRTIERVSLILFAFDRDDVDARNRAIIEEHARRVLPSATIRIDGHTDALGDDEYNRQLSLRRAAAVRDLIVRERERRDMPVPAITVEGIGERVLPYPNDLPEGRMYSRTVLLNIDTPR